MFFFQSKGAAGITNGTFPIWFKVVQVTKGMNILIKQLAKNKNKILIMNWGNQLVCLARLILLSALLLNIYQAEPGGVKQCHTSALIYGQYGTIYSEDGVNRLIKRLYWTHSPLLHSSAATVASAALVTRLLMSSHRVISSHGRLPCVEFVIFRAHASASVRLHCHHHHWSSSDSAFIGCMEETNTASQFSVWPLLLSNRPWLHTAPCWIQCTTPHFKSCKSAGCFEVASDLEWVNVQILA